MSLLSINFSLFLDISVLLLNEVTLGESQADISGASVDSVVDPLFEPSDSESSNDVSDEECDEEEELTEESIQILTPKILRSYRLLYL